MRFSLKTLILATVLLALALAAFGAFGAVVAFLLIALEAHGRSQGRPKRHPIVTAAVIIFFAFIMFVLLMIPRAGGRMEPRGIPCPNNLKQLAVSLWNYEQDHGCLPPAYIADKNGKPMHSWRVLILPYIECGDLYARYNFDEPWDGPNNRRLSAEMPEVFCCRYSLSSERSPGITNYLGVIGPKTAWRGSESRGLDGLEERLPDTILLVEVENSGIHWMEPKDLPFEDGLAGINPDSGVGISSMHGEDSMPDGAYVAMLDGSVHYLPDNTSAKQLENLLRVDRAAGIPQSRRRGDEPIWPRLIAAAGLLAAFALYVLRREKDASRGAASQAVDQHANDGVPASADHGILDP